MQKQPSHEAQLLAALSKGAISGSRELLGKGWLLVAFGRSYKKISALCNLFGVMFVLFE